MIINQANLSGVYRSFSTIFNKEFEAAKSQWPLVAMSVPSTARTNDYKWLGNFPAMKEWVGDRVIKDLSAFHYEIENKDFESTIEIDRNNIEDDQIGLYTPMIQGLAQAAKQHPDVLVFTAMKEGFSQICYDGQYFFDTDHPVGGASVSNFGGGSGTGWYLMDVSRPIKPMILQIRKKPKPVALDKPTDDHVFMRRKYRYGVEDRKNVGFGLWQLIYASKDTLNNTNYAAAKAAMMGFTNDDGVPLGIRATHLVVSPVLEEAGRNLLLVDRLASGAGNPWFKSAELVVVPWLA